MLEPIVTYEHPNGERKETEAANDISAQPAFILHLHNENNGLTYQLNMEDEEKDTGISKIDFAIIPLIK